MRILHKRSCASAAIALFIAIGPYHSFAQERAPKGEWYGSWGYNTEWYTHSSIHISQPSLGNSYTFMHVRGVDHRGWDEGLFSEALSIPQYNYRIGYVFNEEKGLGFEINFDHTKFIFADQYVRVKGTLENHPVDTAIAFNEQNGFYYYLNNGANFLLFNIVKRKHLARTRDAKVKIDFLGKAGIGPVIPHVQNSLFGHPNDQGFQFGGWNIGLEGALRATFFRTFYLEFCNKLDYARYSGLEIYQGKAKQAFGTYEWILNLGVTIPKKKN